MQTVSIDMYRLIAWLMWLAGGIVLGLSVAGSIPEDGALIGLGIGVAGFIPAVESIVLRLSTREYEAYQQGRRDAEQRMHLT